MGKRGHSEKEILRVLREAEWGSTVVEICRKHGISQQSFYLWKKEYAGLVIIAAFVSLLVEPSLAACLQLRLEPIERLLLATFYQLPSSQSANLERVRA